MYNAIIVIIGDEMNIYKKLSIAVIIIAIIGLTINLSYNNENAISKQIVTSKNTVVIDAGHGGKDVGAVGVDGSNEKDINLEIALNLYDFFMVNGINSILTRNGDYQSYFVENERTKEDIYHRMDIVNSTPNSVLISIHQNHFDDEREWGTQVWYSANNDKSKVIADLILNSIKEHIQPENKRVNKVSDISYYLLYKAISPSVMVECGFTSNKEENMKLQAPEYQSNFAYAVMLGVCEEV